MSPPSTVPDTIVPIHGSFGQFPVLDQAPQDIRDRFRWLPIGEPVTMAG